MNEHTITSTVSVILAFIGIAILAIVVSSQASTGNVFKAGGSSIAQLIRCAISPVTGGSCGGTLTNVSSTFSTGCVTVSGQTYCP